MKKEKLIIEADHKHISLLLSILNILYQNKKSCVFKYGEGSGIVMPPFYFRGSVKWKRPYFQKRKLIKQYRKKGLKATEALKKYKQDYWL